MVKMYPRMNRLSSLPRGFGAFQCLEVLDLTYNNLNEGSLPGNFFRLGEFSRNIPPSGVSRAPVGFMLSKMTLKKRSTTFVDSILLHKLRNCLLLIDTIRLLEDFTCHAEVLRLITFSLLLSFLLQKH